MSLKQLTADVCEVVRRCLVASVDGPFFPDEEFSTIFGLERHEVRSVAENWPVDDSVEEVHRAINNSMNNLLGYPHYECEALQRMVGATDAEIRMVYDKWSDSFGVRGIL